MVVFWKNELSNSQKDHTTIENYVMSQLQHCCAPTEVACLTFKEQELYPLAEGLNARSVQALISFAASPRPRA